MKTIYKGKDDLYYVLNIKADNGAILSPSDLDALSIEFYTNGQEKAVFDLEDVTEEGVLHVNAADLAELPDGPLKARFEIKISDDAFADGTYDQTAERLTGYFLKTLPVSEQNETIDPSTND